MQMTQQQKKAVLIGAAGLGAMMLARTWRRRERFDFAGDGYIAKALAELKKPGVTAQAEKPTSKR